MSQALAQTISYVDRAKARAPDRRRGDSARRPDDQHHDAGRSGARRRRPGEIEVVGDLHTGEQVVRSATDSIRDGQKLDISAGNARIDGGALKAICHMRGDRVLCDDGKPH